MKAYYLTLFLLITTFALTACSSAAEAGPIVGEFKVPATTTPEIPDLPPDTCPITQPPAEVFIPPDSVPAEPSPGQFWYGTLELWTSLQLDGRWHSLPYREGSGYGQKVVFWDEEYDWITNQQPELTLTGRRLDGKAPRVEVDHATNGYTPEFGPFMLTGVEIPTTGCWEITGAYEGTELSFVVWVTP